MSVPFTSRLSYALSRAVGRGDIYSHVFEQAGTAGVTGKPDDVRIRTNTYFWLKATKIQGEADAYRLTRYGHRLFARPNGQEISAQRAFERTAWYKVLTRDEVIRQIASWEKDTLSKDAAPTLKQPFKARIQTSLTA